MLCESKVENIISKNMCKGEKILDFLKDRKIKFPFSMKRLDIQIYNA